MLLVLIVPGGALLLTLPNRWGTSSARQTDWLSHLADAVGLSIALSALVALWLFVPGVRLNGLAVAALYGACLLWILFSLARRAVRTRWAALFADRDFFLRLSAVLLGLIGLAALAAWRFYQARGLLLPAWVDSVQHTLIVIKIMEYGGLPPDLSPYLPVPFSYHYGFHLITALFASIAHLTPAQAVLVFGQVLNACVALSVYRLATAFVPKVGQGEGGGWFGGRAFLPVLRGAAAALLVGLAFQMPAYYLSWGRYTLLSGLIVMGPTLAAAYEFWQDPRDRRAAVRFVILLAGVFLVHYFAALLVGMFLLVLGIAALLKAARQRDWRCLPWQLVALSFMGVALAAPWLWRVWQYNQINARLAVVLPPDGSDLSSWVSPDYWTYLLYLWGPRRNVILLALSGIALVFAFLRRELRPLAGWGLLVLVMSTPWGLRLGPFRPDLFNIVVFFPAAVLLGDLLVAAGIALGRVWRPAAGWAALTLALLGLSVWGVRETASILNASTVFVTPADVAALNWVQQNTPADARFLINTTTWQGPIYRGVDGGYWLQPYSGRSTLLPPVAYYWGTEEDLNQITGWVKRSQELTGCTPAFWSLVRDAGLTHIYLRLGVGNLQPNMLAQCARLQLIYDSGGVFIYRIATVP